MTRSRSGMSSPPRTKNINSDRRLLTNGPANGTPNLHVFRLPHLLLRPPRRTQPPLVDSGFETPPLLLYARRDIPIMRTTPAASKKTSRKDHPTHLFFCCWLRERASWGTEPYVALNCCVSFRYTSCLFLWFPPSEQLDLPTS